MNFVIIIFIIFTQGVFSQITNVEFVVDDQKLIYFDQNLTWNEASSLCRSVRSSLVTIARASFASHLLETLASFQAQDLVWIGGRLIHNEWVWKVSGLPIQFERENMSLLSVNNITDHKCLTISTRNFTYPSYVIANCSEARGLLCEKSQQQPTLLVEEFAYNNHNYTIYEGHSSWQTAVAICNKHKMYLSILSSVTELQEIALTLASYTHLDINKVWVGALRDYKKFEWITNGDAVTYTIHNDTKLSNCLTLDIKNQLFYAENCTDGHAFVCESRHVDDDYWESFVHQSNEYTIHSLRTTWEKANRICQSDNSYLATVEDLVTANAIAINMPNAWETLTSVWLGAKSTRIKSHFVYKWQDSGIKLSSKVNESGYPPWKSLLRRKKNSCLILEQSETKRVYFADSACDDVHGFICQRDSSISLAITFNFKVGDKDLLFHDKPEPWFKAQEICKLFYNRLLIVSDPDDLLSIKQFTTRHKLWLDGIYENNKWQWRHETDDSFTDDYLYKLPHVNNSSNSTSAPKCLALQMQKTRPKFVAPSCKTKLPYICEHNSQREQIIKYKGNEYTIINKHLTWQEASTICQAKDQNLAATCDINEVEFLSKFITDYGDLWLGAIKRQKKWIWDAINVTLPHKTNKRIGYPPWLNGKAKREQLSCLSLTLKGSSAVFTDTSCKEIKPFVCEKYSIQSHKHKFLEPRVSELDDRQYVFHPQLSTWKDANEECSDNSAFLSIVSTPQIARHIANLTYGYPEIWIGGHLEENQWKWSINGEYIKNWAENESQWANENEIFDDDFVLKGQYLALNRLNPNIPLFVEKGGNEKLGFVCEKALNIEEDKYIFIEHISYQSGDLQFVANKLNYLDAYDFCGARNGILVMADTPEILEIIARVAEKFHGAWIGATLTSYSQKFLWTHTRNVVTQEIYSSTGDLLNVKIRRKRTADNFKDEVLNKSEIEDEVLRNNTSAESDEDYTSYSAEDADNDGIIESWEVDTDKNTRHYDNAEDDSSNVEDQGSFTRIPRSARKSRKHRKLRKNRDESDGDEVITLPTDYPEVTKVTTGAVVTTIKESMNGTSTTVGSLPTITEVHEPMLITTDASFLKTTMNSIKSKDESLSKIIEVNSSSSESSTKYTTETLIPEATFPIYWENSSEDDDFVKLLKSIDLSERTNENYSRNINITKVILDEIFTSTMPPEIASVESIQNILLQNLIYCLKIDEQGRFVAVKCSTRQSFVCHIRSTNTEVTTEEFSVNNITYLLSNERLSWNKAYKKCNQTYGGYLAIIDDFEEINFVNNISADYQDLWIGAKYDNGWTWLYINEKLRPNDSLWSTDDRLYECANVYRQHSKGLMLVDRDCSEKHGFICKDVKPKITDVEIINGYTIYWRPANFFEALRICAQHNTILIAGDDNEKIINLQKGLHSFWISSLYIHDKWISLKNNTEEIVGFQHVPGRECLSIFKHGSAKYSFVDRDCNIYLPTVCENANNRTVMFNNRSYTFYVSSINWLQASKYCTSKGQYLAIIRDKEAAGFVQNLALVFGDMWVGARLENATKWTWDFTDEIIYDDPITRSTILKPSQRFIDVNSKFCLFAHSFLTQPGLLDRTLCSAPKGFICQGVSVDDVPPIQSIKVNNRIYTLYSRLSTWLEAFEICESNGTYLTVIDTAEEVDALNMFSLSTFWTGGKYEDSWTWNHTGKNIDGQLIPPIKKGFEGHLKNCLSFYKDGVDTKFLNLNCVMRLPFVCEEVGHNNKPQSRRLDFDNEYLILHSFPVTWDEANYMCESAGQHLAAITEENVQHFINLPSEYHDLWLDGKNEDDIWVWTQLDSEILTSYSISINDTNKPIDSFIRNAARPHYSCLTFYRPAVNVFAFLDRLCNDKFGFICQGTKFTQSQIKTMIVGGREYNIYSKKATWAQANKICKSNGTYLAVLNTTEEIELLTQNSIHFVKLWTGAVSKQGGWIWDHTGTKIAINNYTKYLKNDDQCGIIIKSNQGNAALLPKNCTSLYAFVCEERGDQGKWTSTVLNISGHYYSVFSERAVWSHASDRCNENGQYLALIDTEEEMEIINQLNIDYHDLWIGARRAEKSIVWTWKHIGREFPFNKLQEDYPKFANKTIENNCLNIYREWNADSLFIDRDCNEQHGYICESVPISKEYPQILRVSFDGHQYILIQQQLTWENAYRTCNRFNGYLTIISSQREADFLSNVNGAFHDLWIGGRNINSSVWKWYFTGQNISRDVIWERERTRFDHNCLNLYSADGPSGIFMDRKCSEKHSFVCEETHLYEQIRLPGYSHSNFDNFGDAMFPENFSPHFVEYKGKKYMFSSVPVTFNTALESCKKYFGYLLIIDDQAEKEFIANNTQGYHNLWIDGKHQNETWIWEHLGTNISSENFIDYRGRNGHNCLLLYRHDNVSSYYIDRKCQEKHAYVCRDVNEGGVGIEYEFTYKNRYYLLVQNSLVNWYKAEEYCRAQSGYLAILDSTDEAKFIMSLGNDLWVNAKFNNEMNIWTWYHTGQEIIFDNYDIPKYNPSTEAGDKCLNLYGGFNYTPRFVERNCNDNFGFICEDLIALNYDVENVSAKYNGRKYLFVNGKKSWQDAYDACRENGSYLAIISSQEEGKFVAQMTNDFHDMWIDAKFITNSWISIYTGQSIETKQLGPSNEDNITMNLDLIEWASSEKRPGFNCFNAYLPSSGGLIFVDRNCSEEHSFVCEEVVDKPLPSKTIEVAGTRYTINMEAVTWEEAYKRCSKHGYLTIIDSPEEAALLVNSSGEFHSLWIGAQYTKEQWIWNYTGESIEQDFNLWVNVVPQSSFNCTILYRDNSLSPFIVDKSCEDKFGYICEEGEALELTNSQNLIIKHMGKTYTFYKDRLTWEAARNHCESVRSTLAVIDTLELATILTEQSEYYNIWIDGVAEGLQWMWSNTGIHLPPFDNSLINYISPIPRYPQSCLTLFRSNNTVHFLDLDCNDTKPFLCQNYDPKLGGNVTSVERNGTQYYVLHGVKKSWYEAWETCAANGSYLPIVTDERTADFVSSLNSFTKGEIWLGARKFSGWWTWELTEEPLVEGESEMEFPVWERLNQPDNMCLGLDHQTTVFPVFADISCSSSKLIVCEQGCTILPMVNGSWSRQHCTVRVQKVGEECKVNCSPGYLHTGRSNIVCSLNGWSDNIPICTSIRDFSLSIISNVKDALLEQTAKLKQGKKVGLLFLIDSSNVIKWENYEVILEIVKSISVGVRTSNDGALHGIISFEAEAQIEIELEYSDSCSFIRKVNKLAYKSISDIASYTKAFEMAQGSLQNASADGSSVLFIITGSNTTEHLSNDLLNLKQKGNIIFVIGIKPQVNIKLIRQLGSADSSKHHIKVNYLELDEIAYALNRTFLYSGKLGCCMRLRTTNAVTVSPTSCTRDKSPKNARCSIRCNGNHHLQGMESLLCTSEGWQSTLELQRPFPECYSTQRVSHKFIKTMQELYKNKVVDSTLFLIDQSGSMIEEDFYTEIKFVKYLLRMEYSNIGIIIFNSEANVEISLNNYEDPDYICSLYHALDSLSFSGGSTNYEKAFAAASKEIERYMRNCSTCLQQRTLLVMLTDGQSPEIIESAEKLKSQGHIITVISVAVNKRRNLIKLASNAADNSPLLFSLNTFIDLEDMVTYISKELSLKDIVYCCRLPAEFQKQYLKMFIMQSEDVEVTCAPGYSLSIDNNTLKCTEVGLSAIPTCYAVPKKIAEFVGSQFAHIFNQFDRLNNNKDRKQRIVFLIDQTETMTLVKNKQALAFVKSAAALLQLTENRTVGLISGQNHEAVMLIEPNITCPDYFSELLNNVTFTSTSYSMYKPLKYVLEKLVAPNGNVLTVIISDRVYISTPSLKLAHKILATNNNIYVMGVHNETIDSNIASLVQERNDLFISGYYLLKDNLYSIDSFETLEAVAENIRT